MWIKKSEGGAKPSQSCKGRRGRVLVQGIVWHVGARLCGFDPEERGGVSYHGNVPFQEKHFTENARRRISR